MSQKNIDNEVKKIFVVLFKLKKNNIKLSTNFKNTKKWDSLNHIKLIMAIESKFQISIDPDEALRLLSFKDIIKFIRKNKN
jgi:acyl carrier protein